nr:RecName: Full=Unknown protein 11 [Ginkgo biloba]
ANDLVDDK